MLLAAAAAWVCVAVGAAALAACPGPFDGEWGGAKGDVTAQVIVADGAVIGFYWRGDYMDAGAVKVSADERSLTFAFDGGTATLVRTGDATATITITDAGKTTVIALTRD